MTPEELMADLQRQISEGQQKLKDADKELTEAEAEALLEETVEIFSKMMKNPLHPVPDTPAGILANTLMAIASGAGTGLDDNDIAYTIPL